MAEEKILKGIREEIDKISIVDSHEHIRRQSDFIADRQNLFTSLRHCLVYPDFISAGTASTDWERNSTEPEEGWKRIKPYIGDVKTTSYFRTLMIAYKDLFDFRYGEITDANWRELSNKISEVYQREDWYEFVFKQKLNIDVAIWDAFWDPGALEVEKKFFIPTLRMDPFLFVRSKKFVPEYLIEKISEKWGVVYETFDEYLGLIDLAFRKIKEQGRVCIKIAVAYCRPLVFEDVTKTKAEKIFYMPEDEIRRADAKKLEDYIMRFIIRKTWFNLP